MEKSITLARKSKYMKHLEVNEICARPEHGELQAILREIKDLNKWKEITVFLGEKFNMVLRCQLSPN